MKRPSKKEIQEAVKKLKDGPSGPQQIEEQNMSKPPPKKSSQRIRKQAGR